MHAHIAEQLVVAGILLTFQFFELGEQNLFGEGFGGDVATGDAGAQRRNENLRLRPIGAEEQACRLEALRAYPAAGPRLQPGVAFRAPLVTSPELVNAIAVIRSDTASTESAWFSPWYALARQIIAIVPFAYLPIAERAIRTASACLFSRNSV